MQKVTVANVAVATTKFLFGMCDCTVDSDVSKGNYFARAGDFGCLLTCALVIARFSGHGLLCRCYFGIV